MSLFLNIFSALLEKYNLSFYIGSTPFSGLTEQEILYSIIEGKRPDKPPDCPDQL